MPALPAAPPLDVERFYALTRDWDGQVELLDGEVHVVPAPSLAHQVIVVELVTALRVWARERRHVPAPRVLVGPVDVRLDAHTVVQPDVAVWTRALDLARSPGPPPQLAVEVLSPTSRRRDVGPKRAAYARACVAELWLVDPDTRSVTALRAPDRATGEHGVVARVDGARTLTAPLLPAFALPVASLFLD
jgi:Uma2 family endonuclease